MNQLNLAFSINSHLRRIESASDDSSINIWKAYNDKIE